jgi:hypothetical protein
MYNLRKTIQEAIEKLPERDRQGMREALGFPDEIRLIDALAGNPYRSLPDIPSIPQGIYLG